MKGEGTTHFSKEHPHETKAVALQWNEALLQIPLCEAVKTNSQEMTG